MKNKIKKVICFDIDNVLCRTKNSNYSLSKPNIKAIQKINELYKRGYKIIFFTSRYMGRTNNNVKKILIYPKKSKSMNLAFDITPAKYISGLITEKGICEASAKGLKKLFN